MNLPRRYPDVIPRVHPVPEYRAAGDLAARYAEVKRVLQVPWMGVVTMAFAHYPTFFGELWEGVSELCASKPFVAGLRELREAVEAGAIRLAPPPLSGRLVDLGYGEREIDQIRDVLEIFSHGNQPYVVVATIARLLLEGEALGEGARPEPYQGFDGPSASGPLVLMEAHHADEPTRELYQDIKGVLRLPIVNTDYRALARWPSYFSLAWHDLRPRIGGEGHESLCQSVHDQAVDLITQRLPNPGRLTSERLIAAARNDADPEEVLNVVRLFQWLLPGLIVNVAFFRAQLWH